MANKNTIEPRTIEDTVECIEALAEIVKKNDLGKLKINTETYEIVIEGRPCPPPMPAPMPMMGVPAPAAAPAQNAPAQAVGSSDIAFVQVEAVLAQSDLFQSEGAALQEKTKRAQEGWAKKERDLQSKAAQLQEKYQKGLITTANAQSEQEKIQRQIANYQSVAQKEAQTNRAQDLIHRAVQELNADKKYKLILNATSLVDADSLLDITPLVLAKVNELYAADKKADKE